MSIAIKAAAAYAATMHKDQKYGEEPYTKHLAHVGEVLQRFGFSDENLQVAAWLHDVVEDTNSTVEQISMMFGSDVADLVYRVTNEQGKNRKERHSKTYPKIMESERATTLKLADRIANVEQSLIDKSGLLNMYRKEYKDFKEKLYKSGIHDSMWRHLDILIGDSNG